ncbi:MAG TPA: peptidoglycan editing factor PgeF [Candidatus Binataceae bacterium]|nr:peptidoglycan editing factor PgeF [Candidatus Binataceae bacterium]
MAGWRQGALGGTLWAPWDEYPLWHGFLHRRSQAGLPLNFSPAAQASSSNWNRLREHLEGAPELVLMRQVHGSQVHVVAAQERALRPCDGLVSVTPGLVLGILTADCVPLLMLDPQARVVAAVHAGWRGVMGEIAVTAVAQMVALGARPERVQALLGPAIGWCCFEVDRELAARFARTFPTARERTREGRPGKAFVDLHGLLSDQLCGAGLTPDAIHKAPHCTCCHSDEFFSRRGEGGSINGLQLSFVGLRA